MKNTDTADFNEPPPQMLDEINFSELVVFAVLRSLNPDKALGPDGTPGRILKETAQQIVLSISHLAVQTNHFIQR